MKLLALAATLALALGCGPTPSPVVMPNPELHFVVWGNQDATPFAGDWTALLAAGVFDRLAEYGVRGGTVAPTVAALPDLQPAVFDDAWVFGQLAAQIDAANPNAAYIVVLPPGSSTAVLQSEHASGYHFFGAVPYAVVTANEVLISHEVYEMATDPGGLGYRIQGQEVGDLCEGHYDTFAGITVQQVWSVTKGECQ